ncbi:MAG: hypothetical protein ACI4Q0_01015 [Oligosphaeraceae bacterium]
MTPAPESQATPQDWKELFPKQAAALEAANAHHRRGQAYLLVGNSTEEMLVFARGWAKTAACLTPSPQGAACGHCRNCRLFQAGTYTELITLSPESKISNIRVESLREFNRQMALTVPDGLLKFGIITAAEAMMEEAANAFLKTLEEPSDRVMFLLLTTQPHRLLPTIRSRCQTLLLPSLRRNYLQLVPGEFLEILSRLHRGAGAKVALTASREIGSLFLALKKEAGAHLQGSGDKELDELAKKDKALREKLKTLQEARTATEYARQRANYLETIQTWFHQRYLIAAKVPRERLPHQELLPFMDKGMPPATLLEAEEDLKTVERFRKAILAQVAEELCLDAFTLPVCEIPPRPTTL